MKRPLLFGCTILCLAFVFSLTAVIAEDNTLPNTTPEDQIMLAQNSPVQASSAGEDPVSPQAAGTVVENRSTADSFTVEKLVIGLGLVLAIALCIANSALF